MNKKNKEPGYKAGYAFGAGIMVLIFAILAALVYRFVRWIIGF